MKARTNISIKERHSLTLGNFKGVDFSSSPLNVRRDRASNMRNFINENGVNKKRNGWNELLVIKDKDGKAQRINGFFEYVNGEHREKIVHAGKNFYRLTEINGKYSATDITLSSTYTPAKCNVDLLEDRRSQAFFSKGRMYIIGCGDYLVYGAWDNGEKYELRRVANNVDNYIPTTTISIDADGSSDRVRATLDKVNCLQKKRINKLLGNSNTESTWTLDGKIDEDAEISIKLETFDGTTPVEYLIANHPEYKEGKTLVKLKKDGKNIHSLGDVWYLGYSKDEGGELIECGSLTHETGQITLTITTTPQIENSDNISVTFEHTEPGLADRITKCNFGVLFGADGNMDRLFLSGNPTLPNIDFYSESEDFTYFPDQNSCSVGNSFVPIKGYGRLSESTLVIYKEESPNDAKLYFRKGFNKESYDSDGNLSSFYGLFPAYPGSFGEGCISTYASADFAGDSIMLSENGVFGIVLSQNVSTSERYAKERSRPINEKLKRHKKLSEAVGIVYKNRYYLAVDGVCYVADARHKYIPENSVDGSFNYEWWFWDNIPARVWASIGDKLYFGSDKGQVCVFDDKYTDRTYFKFGVGELSLNSSEDNLFDFSENIELSENDRITYSTEGVYALALDNVTVEDGKIKTDGNEIFSFRDGMKVYADEVYADNVYDSGLSVNTEYTVKDIDFGSCTFKLENKDGYDVTPKCGGFRLCYLISNTELYITNIKPGTFQIKRYNAPTSDNNPVITLTVYNKKAPVELLASITHIENVVAEWYTPILDLGTNASSKTLLKMTVSTEPEVNGKLSFGYETRNVSKLINAKGINKFSFDNFSFENFSFETGVANSYSVKCNERNFNFIIFRFVSDNDKNCAVNTFTVSYKINKLNRGVN